MQWLRSGANDGSGSLDIVTWSPDAAIALPDEPEFRRREHRLEAWGWLALATLVVAALLGAAGSGPLSWATVTSGAVTLDYERIERRGSHATVTIRVARLPADGPLQITLAGTWIDRVELREVVPEPAAQVATADGLVLEVAAREPGPVTIVIGFRPEALGRLDAVVTVGSEPMSFGQFVLP